MRYQNYGEEEAPGIDEEAEEEELEEAEEEDEELTEVL